MFVSVLAAAPSKVPFYVAGGVLALWAVGLAVTGIRRPGFPGSKTGRRGVIAASLVLVLTTMSMAVATAGEEHAGAAAVTTRELTLTADPTGVAAFDRKDGAVKAGAVTIRLVNQSPLDHDVAIAQGTHELARSDIIKKADTQLKVNLRPGQYAFYCTVDGHRAAGMEGTLTVR